MKLKALIAAIVGAVGGAFVWSGIAVATRHEVGIVAWAIGGLIGILAVNFGARGNGAAITCASLAVVSIFAGKLMTIQHLVKDMVSTQTTAILTQENYQERKKDSEDFAKLTSEDQWPKFMIDHKFTEASKPDDISSEERNDFREAVEDLRDFQKQQPSFENWRETETNKFNRLGDNLSIGNASIIDATVKTLGAADILFALLGIATAYRIVASAGEGT